MICGNTQPSIPPVTLGALEQFTICGPVPSDCEMGSTGSINLSKVPPSRFSRLLFSSQLHCSKQTQ